jgi:PAS domain-containing protein
VIGEFLQRKSMFDNSWTLSVVLASSAVVVSWYFGLAQFDISPIIWVLAALALAQFALNSRLRKVDTESRVRSRAMLSHALGILMLGAAWHLAGGLQQPLFPLFMALPLIASPLILNFWQQQVSLGVLLIVLGSAVLLSPDTNSFIQARYGIGLVSPDLMPTWMPRSRLAFADVNTSPAFNLLLMGTMAICLMALNAVSRAIIAGLSRSGARSQSLQEELRRAQRITAELIFNAPYPEAIVALSTGRILHASQRFAESFQLPASHDGSFLLDVVKFAYPDVIKRLLNSGGEEIQAATVNGREVVLRVRAATFNLKDSKVARINLENSDDICWRSAFDALEQPAFAVNSHGKVVFLNKSAKAMFGVEAEGADADTVLGLGPSTNRWWDIAPLESARRVVDLRGQPYLASLRRERIAQSIGEMCFVHLHARSSQYAVAAA